VDVIPGNCRHFASPDFLPRPAVEACLASVLSNIALSKRNLFSPDELVPFLLFRRTMGGMAMHAGLFRFESTGLADIRPFSGPTAKRAVKYFRPRLVWLPAILIAGLGGWMMLSGYVDDSAGKQPAGKADIAAIAADEPAQSSAPARPAAQFDPATAAAEAAPVNALRISSQSWRRGGLGSKALVTFTLRNDNDYAVGAIGLLCSFSRADGSPVTERRQTIHDTVKMKSRRTFARVHIGFVNINANRAKCSLLSASRV
jgi:hypothetical protein